MLLLVLAHRHMGRLVGEDVGGHQHRIDVEPDRSGLAVLAGLLLELRHAVQPADAGRAVQDPGKFGMGRDLALVEDHVLLRVDARGDERRRDLADRPRQLVGILRHGDRVHVDHAIEAFMLVLQRDELGDRTEIIAEMEVAGRLDAGEDARLELRHGDLSTKEARVMKRPPQRRKAWQSGARPLGVAVLIRESPYSMTAPRYDVLGLGNAIVDVLARVDDDFLVREGLSKGSMALIDEARAQALYEHVGETVLISGGSAANTCAGVASLGGRVAFIGKVRDDALGHGFADDIRKAGVTYQTAAATDGAATASCVILVTPDGERTMNTFLGASQGLGPEDVDPDLVRASGTIYLEGYLWDPPAAKEAFRRAADIAHEAGRQVALTLSDSFCVERHRTELLDLIRTGRVDLVFANEHEVRALYETADFDTAVAALRGDAKSAVVTRSEKGAIFLGGTEIVAVPAHPVDRVVDATGAGDLYAAGVLIGIARGLSSEQSGRLGALAAAEVLSHMGARPQAKLSELAAKHGL